MPSLLSDTIRTTCKRCGRPFAFELWSVVDTDERPDLGERPRDASIRVFACPACGEQVMSADPLLIHRPRQGALGVLLHACAAGEDEAVVRTESGALAMWLVNALKRDPAGAGIIPTPWASAAIRA
jgi:hypothetical protein